MSTPALLEKARVQDETVRRLRHDWLDSQREAIAAHNESVERHGVFSDGLRGF